MGDSKFFEPPKGEKGEHAYHSPLEKKMKEVLSPFQEYIKDQATASILLLVCTITALIWATIPMISQWYISFVNALLGFHISDFIFEKPLKFWVNDVLLTLFFFFVGLEIKREFLVGELTSHRRALFVLMAAFGGMIVPAGIYFLFNLSTSTQAGWGIPMATDTAFALGILTCFKPKLPKGIFTFMAALAIIDDIGAIIVIATVYTVDLKPILLVPAVILGIILCLMNYAGFRKPFPYIIIGVFIWILIESAGIHGTITGILVAFLIPARPEKGPNQFLKKIKLLLNYFERRKEKTSLILKDQEQHAVLEEVQEVTQQATTPLQRWESKLELPIVLIVLPLFALVNAGIPVNFSLIKEVFYQRVSLGILLGLVIGKPIGILLFSRIALWFRIGVLPVNSSFIHIIPVSILAGIGFTMSLFIANLSFQFEKHALLLSKAAILLSSLTAGILSIILLFFLPKKEDKN